MRKLWPLLLLIPALAFGGPLEEGDARYKAVQDEGVRLPRRAILNITGAGATCTDNPSGKTTECSFTGAGGGLTNAYSTVQSDGAQCTASGSDTVKLRGDAAGIFTTTCTEGTPDVWSSTFATQGANTFFSGPASGPNATPTFRAIVDADIPAAIARDAEAAPPDATYITVDAHAGLSAEQAIGVLGTGLMFNTAGTISTYGGAACGAGTVATATTAAGALTCAIDPIEEGEMDTFAKWVSQVVVTGPCDSSTYVRGDGTCTTPAGANSYATVGGDSGTAAASGADQINIKGDTGGVGTFTCANGTPDACTHAYATQTANTSFMGPATGIPAVPTFRALVAADIPATIARAGCLDLDADTNCEVETSPVAGPVSFDPDSNGGKECTIDKDGIVDCEAHPTLGGALVLKEAVATGTGRNVSIKLPDGGVTASYQHLLTSSGRFPAGSVQSGTGSVCAQFDASGVLTPAGTPCASLVPDAYNSVAGDTGTATASGAAQLKIAGDTGSIVDFVCADAPDTCTATFATETANTVLAGPASAGPSVPTFRALVDADIPAAIARDSELAQAVQWLPAFGTPSLAEAPVGTDGQCTCWVFPVVRASLSAVQSVGYVVSTSDADGVGQLAIYSISGGTRYFAADKALSTTGTKQVLNLDTPVALPAGEYIACDCLADATPNGRLRRAGEGTMFCPSFTHADDVTTAGDAPATLTFTPPIPQVTTCEPPVLWLSTDSTL